jgi:hypothetical protein
MFLAKLVFLHKVLCFEICSFSVCVFPWLSYCYHMSFRFVFWYLRWLQVCAPTSNLIMRFPYWKLQYFINLFDLPIVEFLWVQRSLPLDKNLINLCFIYKLDYLPGGLNKLAWKLLFQQIKLLNSWHLGHSPNICHIWRT